MMGVIDQQKRCVRAAPLDAALLGAAVEQHAEAARVAILPLLRGHFLSRGRQPGHVLDVKLLVERADDKSTTVEDWKGLAGGDQLPGKFAQRTAATERPALD
jgi:hypothetical protein